MLATISAVLRHLNSCCVSRREGAEVYVVLVLGPPNLGLVGFLLAALEEEGVLVASGAGLAQHELERAEALDPLARAASLTSSPIAAAPAANRKAVL
jgi:hypothetical protein